MSMFSSRIFLQSYLLGVHQNYYLCIYFYFLVIFVIHDVMLFLSTSTDQVLGFRF